VSIDNNVAFFNFNDSTESIAQCALSSCSTSNDSNFCAWLDLEAQTLQNKVGGWSISEMNIIKYDFSFVSEIWYWNVLSAVGIDFLDAFLSLEASLDLLHLLFLVEEHPCHVNIPVMELKLVSKVH
jgi:hypothetical protein